VLTEQPTSPDAFVEQAAAALCEHGEGFEVTASYGYVLIPGEASDPDGAVRLADERMYANKSSGRASAGGQTMAVLVRVLAERDPDLGAHVGGVAQLCELVGNTLGLAPEELIPLREAATLHDIGKAAIPDAILNKPGPLSDEEWKYMRRHTILGERIMEGAAALATAAKLVRSAHERFDGQGYPDGLAGTEIPRGSRVIFACDAFDAMVSDRPYRQGMSVQEALDELTRNAGSQFDPEVVTALHQVIVEGPLGADNSQVVALTRA
jgi:two-component system cell cycle response regulator